MNTNRNRTVRELHTRLAMLALFALTVPALARAEQAPQPPAEIARVTALAGNFQGEAQYTAGGKTMSFTLHHHNRVIAGGFGLACDEAADSPEMGHYESENLFGWDAGRRMLHLYSVTSDPSTHDHAGMWRDAKHVTLRYEGLRDGKAMVETIPFEIVGPNEYRFTSTITIKGQAPEVFTATMKRVEGMAGQ